MAINIDETKGAMPEEIGGHVGEIGKMVDLKGVVCTFAREYQRADLSTYWLYKFQAQGYAVIKSFYSGDKFKCSPGERLDIRGKVKEHGQYQMVPETSLSHIKRLSEKAKPKSERMNERGVIAVEDLTHEEKWGVDIPDNELGF